jgi:hypothetical protein
MVMKWLTRRWTQGELSEDEEAAVDAGYLSHVQAVRSRLPEALWLFAGQPDEMGYVSLHDGRVEWWVLDGARSLTLQVICGDHQIGYRRLVIQYRGQVDVFGASESDVAGWLDDAETELLYDEVDIADENRFEHRSLLRPQGEFGVRFEDVVVVSASASSSTYWLVRRRKKLESSATVERLLKAWEVSRFAGTQTVATSLRPSRRDQP